ncbi:MAG: DNA mismatch repair endonuclease MutL [Bacillota bacterium]
MSIKILDKNTAEQIAAGEVIENPASVVKELVENALDAGATKVEVAIEEGGKHSITVTDNGHAIAPEEVPLAFQRFATSKLFALNDLDNLSSLGFRGEALPSIAAVSRVKLISRPKNALSGVQVTVNGGELAEKKEVGAPPGTKVQVNDLFYNTPGRLKFLRANNVESTRISTLLSEMALTHPEVAFTLKSGNRTLFNSSGDGVLLHVIASLYGNETAQSMLELNRKDSVTGSSLRGFIAAPHMTRSSRRWITLVVNGRLIRNAMIVNALERGYGDLLASNRYPVGILSLQVPPSAIDVNVHPAKVEIRFQKPELIKGLVYKAVKLTLQESQSLPKWPETQEDPGYYSADLSYRSRSDAGEVKAKVNNFFREKDSFTEKQDFFNSFPVQAKQEPSSTANSAGESKISGEKKDKAKADQVSTCEEWHLIGQFMQSYIIAQKEDNLLLIDQHAAHERIIYEQLKEKAGVRGLDKTAQLTMPQNLEIPPAWRDRLPLLLPLLEETGFKLEQKDESNYTIKAVPFLLREDAGSLKLYDLLEEIISAGEGSADDYRDSIYKTIACHRSVKARQALSRNEMEYLIREWQQAPRAQYCPHGRPTVISFNKAQLDKSFHRSEGG